MTLAAQDWSRYKPGTVAAIVEEHDASVRSQGGPDSPHWVISGQDFPTAARLTFAAETRPLAPERKELLKRWQTSFNVDPAVLDVFQNEYRFTEAGTDVWLAVQQPLEEALKAEAQVGHEVTALVTFIGAHYAGTAVTWLFLMNEFDAGPP